MLQKYSAEVKGAPQNVHWSFPQKHCMAVPCSGEWWYGEFTTAVYFNRPSMDPSNKLGIDGILVSHQRFDQSMYSNVFEESRKIVECSASWECLVYGKFMLKVNILDRRPRGLPLPPPLGTFADIYFWKPWTLSFPNLIVCKKSVGAFGCGELLKIGTPWKIAKFSFDDEKNQFWTLPTYKSCQYE